MAATRDIVGSGNPADALLAFYVGCGCDHRGRTLSAIWNWPFSRLESEHDYIQWLFPLTEKSRFNPHAPLLDPSVIVAFRSRLELRQNLIRSLDVMLKFYGLEKRTDEQGHMIIARARHFHEQEEHWLRPNNHNHFRITRILKCLFVLELRTEASAFLTCLNSIKHHQPQAITDVTMSCWAAAVKS